MSKFVLNTSRIQQTVAVMNTQNNQPGEMFVQPGGRVRLGIFDKVVELPDGCSLVRDDGSAIEIAPLPQHIPDPADTEVVQTPAE